MRDITGHAANAVATAEEQFARDVHYYLQLEPRQLPSRYLYDALGSALFDAICRLPWYRVTRAELAMLKGFGRQIFAQAGPLSQIVELGPGNGEKLATLLHHIGSEGPVVVHLVDVSPSALEIASRVASSFDGVEVAPHEASYEEGLRQAMSQLHSGLSLVLFLGSNIGNFDRPGREAFLGSIRAALQPGDLFLMGADLVKPPHELLLAYDDPLGVTAAFNRNLICRINRELGGDFALDRFAHRAVWNEAESRVEMHLVSLIRQRVTIAAAALSFTMAADESIWTESSYKFQHHEISTALVRAGFERVRQWVDDEAGFALTLVRAV